jgi:voltage-gated potassium channel
MTIRERLHLIVQPARQGDRASAVFDVFILSLIALNVLAIILDSVRTLREAWHADFYAFEVFSVIVFTAEYLLRIWTSVEDPRYSRPVLGRLRAALSPLLLIDLLAILPFYLPFVALDLRFLRSLRLFRVFRVAKVARYSTALQTLGRVVWSRRAELMVAGFAMFLLMVLSSTLMYYVENDAQPEAFSSVPAAMWWAVTTMTTVGYGDICPITPLGKVLGSFIAILGIGVFAVPTGILGAGFTEEVQRHRHPVKVCPHCGKDISLPHGPVSGPDRAPPK